MSEMASEVLAFAAVASVAPEVARRRRRSLGVRAALVWEVVTGGLIELWAHKLRSILTLTLLMLGVFALVVMTSVLGGVKDSVSTGFAGMSWDGTLVLVPKAAKTSEDQKRFAMSTGLRYEDLARITAPDPRVLGFSPRATHRSVVQAAAGGQRIFVNGVTSDYSFLMSRRVGLGRGLTADDQRRHSTVAVVGATLASKLFGGSDPVGKDLVIEGVPFRIVGVLAGGQIFNEEMYQDANGALVPLETYMDRLDTGHQLTQISVKLKSKRDLDDVSATWSPAPVRPTMASRTWRSRTSTPSWPAATSSSRSRCTAGRWCCSASPARCCWWAASACCR